MSESNRPKLEIHEAAHLFPEMSSEEYADFRDDIRQHGIREPIVIHDGKVIDGRNRVRVAEELGIDVPTREWDGIGSVVDFVVSANLHRRHLTVGQRATCAHDAKSLYAAEAAERENPQTPEGKAEHGRKVTEGRAKRANEATPTPDPNLGQGSDVKQNDLSKRSDRRAGKAFGVGHTSVSKAGKVAKSDPELFKDVKEGKTTLNKAARKVEREARRKAREAKEAEAVARLAESGGSDLFRVVVGDCCDILSDPSFGERPRLIFADPPYNLGVDYGKEVNDKLKEDAYLAWTGRWILACAKVLAPDGTMIVLMPEEWAGQASVMLRQAGLHRRRWIVWYESFGVNTDKNFNRCSRHLLYFVKNPRKFTFHREAVSRPSDRQEKYGDARADPAGKIWDSVWGINPPIPRLVDNAAERLSDFPTQLPLALLDPIIGFASDPGDLVLDPFLGSGTTLVSAVTQGRRGLGIDKVAKWAKLSESRIGAAAAGYADSMMKPTAEPVAS